MSDHHISESPNIANHPMVPENNNSIGFPQQYEVLQQQPPPTYRPEPEEVVQVVFQSNSEGSMVDVKTSLLTSDSLDFENTGTTVLHHDSSNPSSEYSRDEIVSSSQRMSMDASIVPMSSHQQLSRATSTLPSVAEESSSGNGAASGGYPTEDDGLADLQLEAEQAEDTTSRSFSGANEEFGEFNNYTNQLYQQQPQQAAIYSTIRKQNKSSSRAFAFDSSEDHNNLSSVNPQQVSSEHQNIKIKSIPEHMDINQQQRQQQQQTTNEQNYYNNYYETASSTLECGQQDQLNSSLVAGEEMTSSNQQSLVQQNYTSSYGLDINNNNNVVDEENDEPVGEDFDAEISQILARHKQGAAESGSFRNNFKRKNYGVSASTIENDLTAHRQKLLESQEANISLQQEGDDDGTSSGMQSLKRNHSVSFNMHSSRSSRHSVDIRNLPSYLSVKRASIVDVAKGAMSSLMMSFGGSSSTSRRNSSIDEEPIFEEPIAPTLSLGQRVALVKNNGAEFGTVGWIGQLPDVDFDWIVGVIFDNMIGNSDGSHNGVRYFYARENYAMFVPLSTLTKTDNYIGRPETGTMLSRMSVSLKPGQLISIQRSSIRLQHCFLNAPHQRVGHDVRAVSNRLHCQCHNCGPCAHLTKQGNRFTSIPPFGVHHAPNKKNSLAHAAVEILAHHHHHYHEEEHKEEENYQFGDNAAHACNFVRYSCCQQNGTAGHDFSNDCQMVRPELLDNLIHAPRAPHRRHRLRRMKQIKSEMMQHQQQVPLSIADNQNLDSNLSTLENNNETMKSWQESERTHNGSEASYSSSGSSSPSSSVSEGSYYNNHQNNPYVTNGYCYDTLSTQQHSTNMYNTIDSRMSVLDQQRFIWRSESAAFSAQSSDYYGGQNSGFGSRIRRCFACIMGRKKRPRKRGFKKQKTSAKERLIEYRRKQSTFVPSTLAKPQEDFASHGLILPGDPNSDYSSYSRSSNSSSPYHSPSRTNIFHAEAALGSNQLVGSSQILQSTTVQNEEPNSNEQLKSSHTFHCNPINYDGYITPSEKSFKKNEQSYDSALTDQGYFDSWTERSDDTLKHIVDQSINEEVVRPEEILINGGGEVEISPILSNTDSESNEQAAEISSPTASLVDHSVNRTMRNLDLNKELDEP